MRKIIKRLICLALAIGLLNPGVSVFAASKGEELAALACTYVGSSYVYGAAGPTTFDCSGFTQFIYKQYGINIPHSTYAFQNGGYANYGGRRVALSNLQPGDLVFFGYSENNITHVAIYVRNGMVVNALNEKYGVDYTYLTQELCRQYGGRIYWNTANGTYPLFGVRFFADQTDFVDYGGQREDTPAQTPQTQVPSNNVDHNENGYIDTDLSNGFMMSINQIPFGEIDAVSVNEQTVSINGWALDLDHTDSKVNMRVYLDDQYIGAISTTEVDEWVNSYYHVSNAHGFNVSLVTDLIGTYTLSIYATDEDTGEDILIGSESITTTKKESYFTDVVKGKWYYDIIQEVYSLKLMTGTTETTFDPSGTMTRAMVATVLYRMAGSEEVTYTQYFTDVAANKYYSNAITWCKENGIITGYSNGTFDPGKSITRQDLAVILEKYAKYCGMDTTSNISIDSFGDNTSVSSYARNSLKWAVENKIMSGSNGNLNPTSNATRAQCAKMLLATYKLTN